MAAKHVGTKPPLRNLAITTPVPNRLTMTANGAVGRWAHSFTQLRAQVGGQSATEHAAGEESSTIEHLYVETAGHAESMEKLRNATLNPVPLAQQPLPRQPLPQNGLLCTANGAVGRGQMGEYVPKHVAGVKCMAHGKSLGNIPTVANHVEPYPPLRKIATLTSVPHSSMDQGMS